MVTTIVVVVAGAFVGAVTRAGWHARQGRRFVANLRAADRRPRTG